MRNTSLSGYVLSGNVAGQILRSNEGKVAREPSCRERERRTASESREQPLDIVEYDGSDRHHERGHLAAQEAVKARHHSTDDRGRGQFSPTDS